MGPLKRFNRLNFIGYFNGDIFHFSQNEADKTLVKAIGNNVLSPFLLIVNRQCYHEVNKSYPIENASEVKKLINLQYEGQRIIYNIIKVESGKSLVNIWIFKTDIPSSIITIPESFLLSGLHGADKIICIDTAPKQFVALQNGVVHSQLANDLITSPESFAMSVGIPLQSEVVQFSKNEYPTRLFSSLKKLPVLSYFKFAVLPKLELTQKGIISVLAPSLILALLYLMATSIFIYANKVYLQKQIQSVNTDVKAAMDESEKVERKVERYDAVQSFMASKLPAELVWFIMVDAFSTADITQFDFTQQRFVLRGQTERATSLLEKLNHNTMVQDVRFDEPVRSNKGKEIFVISFTIKSHAQPLLKGEG